MEDTTAMNSRGSEVPTNPTEGEKPSVDLSSLTPAQVRQRRASIAFRKWWEGLLAKARQSDCAK